MDPNTKYYKITNKKEIHDGYEYHDGLNIVTEPFAEEGSCVPGGFYFTTIEHIHKFFSYGINLREVSFPNDPKLRIVKDPSGDKWRSNMIFLGKKYSLNDHLTYKFLIECGINIYVGNEYILDWSAQKGYLDVVQFLVEKGVDIHANND